MEGFHAPLEKYQYRFENLVFEGGPNRLLPYCGAVKTMEECGAWKQMKRLAGSGTGAVMASLLAVGLTGQQLEQLFKDDLDDVIRDGKLSKCCLCCAASGYNPGKAVIKWLGARFKECTGKSDITFSEVQKRFNKELCVVATNLTEGKVEYHHAKTTPDMKVVDSVRMSLAFPVLMEAVTDSIVNDNDKKKKKTKTESCFVEGGILCNYPIHAYDGWWLSLDDEQTFLKRLPQANSPLADRFSAFNRKTLGIIACDGPSLHKLPPKLREQAESCDRSTRPQDTKLLKNIEKLASDKAKLESKYAEYSALASQLIKNIEEQKKARFDIFTKEDLRSYFTKSQLSDDEMNLLFGTNQIDDIFRKFIPKNKKEVSVQDVYNFLERGRRSAQASVDHVNSRRLAGNAERLEALSQILHENSLASTIDDKNVERTIVIPTGYIDSKVKGKSLTKQDKQYLVEQGRAAARHFLEAYIKRAPLLKDEGETAVGTGDERANKCSFSREDLKQFIDDDISEVIDEKDYLESYLERVL